MRCQKCKIRVCGKYFLSTDGSDDCKAGTDLTSAIRANLTHICTSVTYSHGMNFTYKYKFKFTNTNTDSSFQIKIQFQLYKYKCTYKCVELHCAHQIWQPGRVRSAGGVDNEMEI